MKKILLLPLILLLAARAPAAPPSPESAEGILSFADALYQNDDSYRAATEYMRVLHHFSEEDNLAKRALAGLGKSYASAKRWEDASGAYGALFERDPSDQNRLNYGSALYLAGRHSPAVTVLSAKSGEKPQFKTLATLAWLKSGDSEAFNPTLDGKLVAEYENLPRKSPAVAGALSALLPGSGHLYVERPADAFTAFVVNGLFIWGTVNAARQGRTETAAVLGAVELAWYSGTIAGAMIGAGKYNEREREVFFRRAEEGIMPSLTLAPLPDGALIIAAKRF